ncbi:hypothetical protein OsJ_23375 [Oryza sativa Japonica Group]|uniref:Uncharacterized protein n=1 Tax=Oryza sativa subsp. japonica TaxID=39947 RepID=B9FVW9_ORYSJ|nr:hypothetical protein OsJ_23375 [Oryza sativa Japonica Group]
MTLSVTNGRNIYDGCYLLDVQHVHPFNGNGVDMTPTKCLTLGPSSITTRPAVESSLAAPEHVFPATMNSSTPSTTAAAIATPSPSIKTNKAEGDMAQVEMKPKDTFQELCAKIIATLNNMLVTCRNIKLESITSVGITRVVTAKSTNTKSVPNTLEVSDEANSISLVDTNEFYMVTTTKCLTKGNEQMINDDDDDMATEDLVELTKVNSKFTLLQTGSSPPVSPWESGNSMKLKLKLEHYNYLAVYTTRNSIEVDCQGEASKTPISERTCYIELRPWPPPYFLLNEVIKEVLEICHQVNMNGISSYVWENIQGLLMLDDQVFQSSTQWQSAMYKEMNCLELLIGLELLRGQIHSCWREMAQLKIPWTPPLNACVVTLLAHARESFSCKCKIKGSYTIVGLWKHEFWQPTVKTSDWYTKSCTYSWVSLNSKLINLNEVIPVDMLQLPTSDEEFVIWPRPIGWFATSNQFANLGLGYSSYHLVRVTTKIVSLKKSWLWEIVEEHSKPGPQDKHWKGRITSSGSHCCLVILIHYAPCN